MANSLPHLGRRPCYLRNRRRRHHDARVDAIVNAANRRCSAAAESTAPSIGRGTGAARGVPHARRLSDGEAQMTRGYQLPARHVIHTVGPVWHEGGGGGRVAGELLSLDR